MKIEEIQEAKNILNLPEKVSFLYIKKVYISLCRKYHPDRCKETECLEKFKKINWAYNILKEYYFNYPLSLKEEDILISERNTLPYDHYKKFYEDWWA